MSHQILEALFMQQRIQIMHIGTHFNEYSDSYLYAWYEGVYPISEDSDGSVMKRPHEAYEVFFEVSKAKIKILRDHLVSCWENKTVPTFYELEEEFGVSSHVNGTHFGVEWSRDDLLHVCRYYFLEKHFDKSFWSTLLTPFQHPSEAGFIVQPFDREADIYFMW